MTSLQENKVLIRLTLFLFFSALVIAFMIAGRELFIPIAIAFFLTFLLLPISRKLESWRIPRIPAILISIICAIAVLGSLIYFFYTQIMIFGEDLPELKQKFSEKMDQLHMFVRENFNISKGEQTKWINEKVNETAAGGDKMIITLFSLTGTFLANLALIPIYIFFLTYYKEKYKNFILLVFKSENHDHVLQTIRKISRVSQHYLKGIFLDILILSILNSIGFTLLGIKHAILFGVMASILNIIPYVGVLIGSLLPITMALLTKDEIGYALGAAGVCLFVQFLDNNFITPYVVGSSVSINPLSATIALVASAMIWGIPGMILSMPIMGVLKVILDNVPQLRPYGYALGEEAEYSESGDPPQKKGTGILKIKRKR